MHISQIATVTYCARCRIEEGARAKLLKKLGDLVKEEDLQRCDDVLCVQGNRDVHHWLHVNMLYQR